MPSHITFKTNYSINLYLLAKNIFININTNMITNNYNSINFGARFINNVKIQKYNDETNSYDNVKASFVEFDPKNDKDLKAVQKVGTGWYGQVIAKNVSDYAELKAENNWQTQNKKIYILTAQKNGFRDLKSDKILGLTMTSHSPCTGDEIDLLQTKPDCKHIERNRPYKGIGKNILQSLQKIYNKTFELTSTVEGANFYEAMGLELIDKACLRYKWTNPKLLKK